MSAVTGDSLMTEQAAASREKLIFTLAITLFFVSGLTSLIYQVVWTRMLVFVFGSTTFASATVLAVFMGGLALGSFIAGRVSDRLKRPFLWYGILEGIIGLWAILAPFMFDAAVPLYKMIWQAFHLSTIPFSLLRFMVAAVVLLPPTTCMGATLPLLSRFLTRKLDYVGDRVGTLYAVNTLGAVVGAGIAGFLLLPGLGLHITTMIAAAGNLLLCLIVFGCERGFNKFASNAVEETQSSASPSERTKLPPRVIAALCAFAFSGAIAMTYEVAWTRTLLMVIGSTTYAFTIMLCTFLIGIFLGSIAMAKYVDRLKEPLAWFAFIQLILCLAGLFSVQIFNYVPYWNLAINAHFIKEANAALAVRFLLSAAVLMPITLCLGAVFPLVVKACTTDLEKVGRSIGSIYSSNTLGAIIGAFLAGFVIVPAFGAEKTLIYASVSNLIIAVALLWFVPVVRPSIKGIAAVACACATFFAISIPSVWDHVVLVSAQKERRNLTMGIGYKGGVPPYEEWRRQLDEAGKVLFWKDGACATVGVLGYKDSNIRSLFTNGHVDASDMDFSTFTSLVSYPMLLKPDAKEIGIIGWGSGISAGVAGLVDNTRVTGIEIEPAVVDAGRLFKPKNFDPEDNSRVKIEMNDGRNYMLATDRKFDLIVSQPSNPWQAGVCNLFTKEYFKVCSERLAPGGIFTAWIQLDEIAPENVLGILSALDQTFKYLIPIASDEGDLIVIASQEPLKISYKQAQESIMRSPLKKAFATGDIFDAEDFIARVIATPIAIKALTEAVEPNTDDRNRLEYAVQKTYENMFFSLANRKMFAEKGGNLWDVVDWGDMSKEKQAEVMTRIAAKISAMKNPVRSLAWSKAAFRLKPNSEALRLQAISAIEIGNIQEAFKLFDDALALDPQNKDARLTRGLVMFRLGRIDAAREDFLTVLKVDPQNKIAKLYMAQTYMSAESTQLPYGHGAPSDPSQAWNYLKPLVADEAFVKKHQDVLYLSGVANLRLAKYEDAARYLKAYVKKDSDNVEAWRALGSVLYSLGNPLEGSFCWERSLFLGKEKSRALLVSAREEFRDNRPKTAIKTITHAIDLYPGNLAALELLSQAAQKSPDAAKVVESLQTLRAKDK